MLQIEFHVSRVSRAANSGHSEKFPQGEFTLPENVNQSGGASEGRGTRKEHAKKDFDIESLKCLP